MDDPWGFGTPTQYPTLKGSGHAPDPDLVVDTLTLRGAPAGVSFTLSARVRNRGHRGVRHHPTLLPLHRFENHDVRHTGGHGLRERLGRVRRQRPSRSV